MIGVVGGGSKTLKDEAILMCCRKIVAANHHRAFANEAPDIVIGHIGKEVIAKLKGCSPVVSSIVFRDPHCETFSPTSGVLAIAEALRRFPEEQIYVAAMDLYLEREFDKDDKHIAHSRLNQALALNNLKKTFFQLIFCESLLIAIDEVIKRNGRQK